VLERDLTLPRVRVDSHVEGWLALCPDGDRLEPICQTANIVDANSLEPAPERSPARPFDKHAEAHLFRGADGRVGGVVDVHLGFGLVDVKAQRAVLLRRDEGNDIVFVDRHASERMWPRVRECSHVSRDPNRAARLLGGA
jgi:hypothetical protein